MKSVHQHSSSETGTLTFSSPQAEAFHSRPPNRVLLNSSIRSNNYKRSEQILSTTADVQSFTPSLFLCKPGTPPQPPTGEHLVLENWLELISNQTADLVNGSNAAASISEADKKTMATTSLPNYAMGWSYNDSLFSNSTSSLSPCIQNEQSSDWFWGSHGNESLNSFETSTSEVQYQPTSSYNEEPSACNLNQRSSSVEFCEQEESNMIQDHAIERSGVVSPNNDQQSSPFNGSNETRSCSPFLDRFPSPSGTTTARELIPFTVRPKRFNAQNHSPNQNKYQVKTSPSRPKSPPTSPITTELRACTTCMPIPSTVKPSQLALPRPLLNNIPSNSNYLSSPTLSSLASLAQFYVPAPYPKFSVESSPPVGPSAILLSRPGELLQGDIAPPITTMQSAHSPTIEINRIQTPSGDSHYDHGRTVGAWPDAVPKSTGRYLSKQLIRYVVDSLVPCSRRRGTKSL